MAIIESISTIVSLLGVGNTLYDYTSGMTIKKQIGALDFQLKSMNLKLKKLDEKFFYLPQNEIIDITDTQKKGETDIKKIWDMSQNLRNTSDSNIIISTPIDTPNKMKNRFLANPEKILIDICPINGFLESTIKNINDSTLRPIVFSKWNQQFIGFIKIGYFEDYFDCKVRSNNYSTQTSSLRFDGIYQSPPK